MKRRSHIVSTSKRALILLAGVGLIAAAVLFLMLLGPESVSPVFVPITAPDTISGGQHTDQILIRGDWGYPPFEYLNESGEPDGFNIDILRRIAEIMELDIRISLGPWEEVRGELERGEIDALAGMYKTELRDETADYSIPHFIASYGVFVPRDSGIRRIQDIQDKRILVQSEDLGHDYLVENNIGSDLVTVDGWEAVLPALEDGKADCAVMGMVQGLRILRNQRRQGIRILSAPLLRRPYSIAVQEGDKELLALFNEGLNLLKISGEYDDIYQKWFGVYESTRSWSHPVVRGLAAGVLVLTIVLIAIVLWSWSLRRQVGKQTANLTAAMRQLEEAHRTKDRFLAGVSHELRTPLHGMIGMVQLMEKTDLDKKQADLLASLKTGSSQLNRVLSDLIDISRLDSGKLSFSESSFPLEEVATWIEPVLWESANRRGLDLTVSIDENVNDVIVSDKERITQVILNLADNAIKNTDAGSVVVRLACENQSSEDKGILTIEVQDSGRGISQENHQRIFSAFTQLEASPGTLTPGLGLGLSIVKSITELMNGSIDVQSAPGSGSTFTVRLPVRWDRRQSHISGTAKDGTARTSADSEASGRVLIAEDEAINRLYLEQLLGARGWKTTAVPDGDEAVKEFAGSRYDIVLLDLSMPKLGGLEASRRIRDIELHAGSGRVPIVALTAHAYEEKRQECRAAGMDGFVTKPFREDALWTEIERVLEENSRNGVPGT